MHDYKIDILEVWQEVLKDSTNEAVKKLAEQGKVLSFIHYHFSFLPFKCTEEKCREYRHSIWNMMSEEYPYNLTKEDLETHIKADLDKWVAADYGLDHIVASRRFRDYGIKVLHSILLPLPQQRAKE